MNYSKNSNKTNKKDHDGSYHQLFDHPTMIARLLDIYVAYDVSRILNVSKMERVNAKLHAEGLQRRDGDIIYRIPREDGEAGLYVYLMLEFQSSPDRWMAVRMLAYIALLYQHIIRQENLGTDDLLPPVMPIVLYNGKDTWTAPTALRNLVAADATMPIRAWQPDFQYYLLNESTLETRELEQRLDPVSLLFQMEQSSSPEGLVVLIDKLMKQLNGPQFNTLRRAFASWLLAVLLPNKGVRLNTERLEKLGEVRNMLAQNVKGWQQRWLEEGLEKGLEEGELRGELRSKREDVLLVLTSKFGQEQMWASHLKDMNNVESLKRLLKAAALADAPDEILELLKSEDFA